MVDSRERADARADALISASPILTPEKPDRSIGFGRPAARACIHFGEARVGRSLRHKCVTWGWTMTRPDTACQTQMALPSRKCFPVVCAGTLSPIDNPPSSARGASRPATRADPPVRIARPNSAGAEHPILSQSPNLIKILSSLQRYHRPRESDSESAHAREPAHCL